MKIILLYIFSLSIFLYSSVNAAHSNKTIEGYRAGYLKECPGSMKPIAISRKHYKFIEIFVSGAKATSRKRNRYTYNTKRLLAKDPTMDWSKPTLFYIPAWMDNIHLPMGRLMEALYKRKGYNVWILNEAVLVTQEFPMAARVIMAIGDHVGEMLALLTANQPQFDPKKLELLGLSLGGHTMSFIAKAYTRLTGLKVSRLTGMDVAGPCFRNRGPEGRVDDSDADFVDLIMTNIDGLGIASPVGHVNYYVNGGEIQPGDLYWMHCGSFCSHARSYPLWVAALLYPESFIAIKCDSVQDARYRNCYDRKPMETNLLGLNVDKNNTGIFYLATTNFFPFYMGKNGLVKENDYVLKQLRHITRHDNEVV